MRQVTIFLFIVISVFWSLELNGQCLGGNPLETTEGEKVVSFCLDQGGDQSIVLDPGIIGTPYAYILTDEDGMIKKITNRPLFDLSNSEEGTCYIYGISYAGTLNRRATGENILSAELASVCFEFASNRIRIEKSSATGGEISLSDGTTEASVCAQDGQPDTLSFETDSPDDPYVYLILDEGGTILNIVDSMYDFNQPGPEQSVVVGLSYSGMLLASEGQNAFEDELADGCYALSDNEINILRTSVDGGTVSTVNDKEEVFTCVADGRPDSLFFKNTSSSSADYIYVITNQDDVVSGFTRNGADFEAPFPATCKVYGLSYAGALELEIGDTIGLQEPVDGCFDWSGNSVEVNKNIPDGGTVTTVDGAETIYTCPGDGDPDVYLFTAENTVSGNYSFALTDSNGIVREILPGNNYNFEDLSPGTVFIYGIAYTGDLLIQQGDTITGDTLSEECSDLSSNRIEVIIDVPQGGTLSYKGGGDTLEICKGDEISDVSVVVKSNTSNSLYTYVFTDSAGQILDTVGSDSIDFEESPDGTARIYGLAYTGSLQVEAGNHIDSANWSDDCYDVSENYLTLSPLDIEAGKIRSPLGDSVVFLCAEDTSITEYYFSNTSDSSNNYAYVLTKDSVIETILMNDTLDLPSFPQGKYRVRGLAYTGTLNLEPGDTLPTVPSNSCFDWSSNDITFNYNIPVVGDIMHNGGGLTEEFCSNDSNQVLHLNRSGGTPTPFLWVLTQEDGTVLGLVSEDSISFSTAPSGTYFIYGITGSPLPDLTIGLPLEPDTLDDDICLDVSDTTIQVIKTGIDGGSIQYADGSEIAYFCPGDTMEDLVIVDRMGETGNQYAYFCVDENNVIRTGTNTDTLNVSALPSGEYAIVGISYNGTLLPQIGDTLGNTPLSTGCSSLSEHRLQLIGEVPEGGTVQTIEGEVEVEVNVGDGIPDTYTLESLGASNTPYRFVVVDSMDRVLVILPDSTVDFEMVPPGDYSVYGVAFTGELLITGGEDIATAMLSDDCYDLSDNAVVFHLRSDTSGLTGTEQNREMPFEMTVRSSTASLNISLRANQEIKSSGTIGVFDLSGQLLYREKVSQHLRFREIEVPLKNRATSMYLIQLQMNDGRNWTRKVFTTGYR